MKQARSQSRSRTDAIGGANLRVAKDGGFSLIEVVVALGVFSIAVLALMNAQSEHVRTVTAVEERTMARIVAENQLVEALAAVKPLELGRASGTEDLGGRRWVWSLRVVPTQNKSIRRIEVNVRNDDSQQVLATLSAFKGVR